MRDLISYGKVQESPFPNRDLRQDPRDPGGPKRCQLSYRYSRRVTSRPTKRCGGARVVATTPSCRRCSHSSRPWGFPRRELRRGLRNRLLQPVSPTTWTRSASIRFTAGLQESPRGSRWPDRSWRSGSQRGMVTPCLSAATT